MDQPGREFWSRHGKPMIAVDEVNNSTSVSLLAAWTDVVVLARVVATDPYRSPDADTHRMREGRTKLTLQDRAGRRYSIVLSRYHTADCFLDAAPPEGEFVFLVNASSGRERADGIDYVCSTFHSCVWGEQALGGGLRQMLVSDRVARRGTPGELEKFYREMSAAVHERLSQAPHAGRSYLQTMGQQPVSCGVRFRDVWGGIVGQLGFDVTVTRTRSGEIRIWNRTNSPIYKLGDRGWLVFLDRQGRVIGTSAHSRNGVSYRTLAATRTTTVAVPLDAKRCADRTSELADGSYAAYVLIYRGPGKDEQPDGLTTSSPQYAFGVTAVVRDGTVVSLTDPRDP